MVIDQQVATRCHGPRVAVVDSGIDATHGRMGVVHHVHLDGFTSGSSDRVGHGTACAGIILGKTPDAILYSIPIFDETLTASGEALLAAIVWTLENRMDVANLSLGTTDLNFRDLLADVCSQASRAGVILVAAERIDGQPSYPAAFADVIGVRAGTVSNRNGFYYRAGGPTECVANGDAQRVCWRGDGYRVVSGSSFASAHITGVVAGVRQAHPEASLERVRGILETNALGRWPEAGDASRQAVSSASSSREFNWMKRVALYPFNKEMHALVRGRDLLGFDIVGIADPPGKGLVGRDAGETLGMLPIGVRIQPRLSAALEEADTLILGYVGLLGQVRRRNTLCEAVETAIDRGVNVFSFEPVPATLRSRAEARGLQIDVPTLSEMEVKQALKRDPEYPPVDVPVLGVFGTSAEQGKFTLQLGLRRLLLGRGYTVGQVGTEHHSELFGMDVVFPMGYASTVPLPLESYVPFLGSIRVLQRENVST